MTFYRRPLSFALAAAVACSVLSVLAVPAAARASGTITISWAGSPEANAGQLEVQASATSPINYIEAHLISSTGQDVLDVSDFQLVPGGLFTDGTFAVETPITTAQLPLGSYTVKVDATDTGGDSVTGVTAGTLDFVIQPALTIKASRTLVDYDNQSVTFSGTATGTWPDGTTGPLPGLTVDLVGGRSDSTMTASDGTYSITVNEAEPGTYWVQTPGSATVASSSFFGPVQVSEQVDQVRVTAKISTRHVNYGKSVTISGTVQYKPHSSWVPLPGGLVDIDGGPYPQPPPVKTVTASAAGTFSVSVPDLSAGPVSVSAGGVSLTNTYLDGLLTTASISLPLTVALPVRIVSARASLSPLGLVTLTGCVEIQHADAVPNLALAVEASLSKSGPWKTIKTDHGPFYSGCSTSAPADGTVISTEFDTTLPAVGDPAYYRVRLAATPELQAATSQAALGFLYRTKITSISVSPSEVPKGGTATVKGRLWRAVSAKTTSARDWKAYGARTVIVIYRLKGKKDWDELGPVKTNSAGRFSLRFADYASATLSALYLGDSKHLWSQGGTAKITVEGGSSAASQGEGRRLTLPAAVPVLVSP